MKAFFAVFALAIAGSAMAQQPPPAAAVPDPASIAATGARLTQLRDNFIASARAAGLTCTLAPPPVQVTEVHSWGNYNGDSNVVLTPDWSQLSPEDRAFFARLAGPGADEAATRATFETAAHKWIFIHEMGHWVQHCQKADAGATPWQLESGANRVANAYWRTTDTAALAQFFAAADAALASMPNPLPPGADMVAYFNTNYGEKLAATQAYPWFQAKMIVEVRNEKPQPGFAETLRNPAK